MWFGCLHCTSGTEWSAHSCIWWTKWCFWKSLVWRGCRWLQCEFSTWVAHSSSSDVVRASLPRHTLAWPGFAATPGAGSALFSPPLFAPRHRAKLTANPVWILEYRETPAQSFSQAVLTLDRVQASFSPALLPQRYSQSTAMAPAWMPPAAGSDSAGVQ